MIQLFSIHRPETHQRDKTAAKSGIQEETLNLKRTKHTPLFYKILIRKNYFTLEVANMIVNFLTFNRTSDTMEIIEIATNYKLNESAGFQQLENSETQSETMESKKIKHNKNEQINN